jgi:hypothetical protein
VGQGTYLRRIITFGQGAGERRDSVVGGRQGKWVRPGLHVVER